MALVVPDSAVVGAVVFDEAIMPPPERSEAVGRDEFSTASSNCQNGRLPSDASCSVTATFMLQLEQ